MGGDRSSLNYLRSKYGDDEGSRLYKIRCDAMSVFKKGKPSPTLGMKVSDETKEKTRNSVLNSEYHMSMKGKSYVEKYGEDKRKSLSQKMKGWVYTLPWFEEKYGDTEGRRLYDQRCINIKIKSYFKWFNKINKNNYSKSSQELFWRLQKELNLDKVYFAEFNHECSAGTDKNFDFVDVIQKRIIEFHGDLFHANPKTYGPDDHPNPYNKFLTSKEIWAMDKLKQQSALKHGYQIMIVWYSEYIDDKDKIYEKCKQFLS